MATGVELNLLVEKVKNLSLSRREKEVIFYWINGWNYKDIAKEMKLAETTIRTYIYRINIKMNTRSKVELLLVVLEI